MIATSQDYSSSGASVTTTTTTYREDADPGARRLPGRPHSIQRPDNTMEVHLYFRGTYDSWWRQFYFSPGGFGFAEYVLQGTTAPQVGDGAVSLSSYGPSDQSNFIANNFYVVPGKSTMNVTVRDYDGTLAMTQSWSYTSSGWVLVDRVTMGYDATHHVFPMNVRRDSGNAGSAGDLANIMEVSETGWQYGRVQWTADNSGAKRWFTYDAKGRVIQEKLESIAGQPQAGEQWTIHTFDPVDRETRTTLAGNGSGGDPGNDVVTEADYDLASRVTQSRRWGQSAWISTTPTYFYGNPRTTQATHPSGGTTISEVHLDGRPKSVTGTAQPPKYFGYYVGSNGYVRTQENLNNVPWGDGWTDVERDWLGRTNYVARPTGNNSTNFDNHTYNSLGQLVARQRNVANGSGPLLAATRYVYGSMGELTRDGLDVNENGALDDTGVDRVTTHAYAFTQPYGDGTWWRETTSKTLTNPGNATDGVQTIVRERLTGRTATNRSETRAIDANNQTTTTLTWVDRANKTVEERTTVPGSTTTAKRISKNGFLAQTISAEGVTTTYTYDVYGRLTKSQGRESVWDEKTYYPKSTLVKNLRNAILGQGFDWQIFSYDTAARLATHQTNNVNVWKTARYEYDAAGRLIHQWGDAATPVEHGYNTYGWRTNMRLYRNGSNWNASTWSSAVSGATADTTTWAYHGATGLVTSKTDPANRTVGFTFNHRNQVVTRTWARGVVATYAYCDSAGYRTGELASVSYNDGTPTVSYQYANWAGTYTRTGNVMGVVDVTGQRWFNYRMHDQQPEFEYVGYYFYGSSGGNGRGVWRDYDSLGRATGFRAGYGNDTTAIQQTSYGYDSATGRVGSIGSWHPNIGWYTFTYGYRTNSNLVEAVAGSGFGFRRDTYWQSWRNLEDYVATSWSGSTRANFHYDYDWVEQRIGEDHNDSLSAYLNYASGIDTDYLFTPKGEVDWVNATHGSGGPQITNRYRDWVYDQAGNRDFEYKNSGNVDFVANNLNQYTAAGPAHSYDLDGNLENDGTWTCAYDGENRLASMASSSQALLFTYDHLGRRVGKDFFGSTGLKAEYFNNTSLSGTPALTRVDSTVDFQWNGASPGPGVNGTEISVRWTGVVTPPSTGTWTFYTDSDDGVRLWVNGQLLIDDWTYHGWTTDSGSISLMAGRAYTIRMEWFQGGGGAVARLHWAGPGTSDQIIGASYMRAQSTSRRFIYDNWNLIAEIRGENEDSSMGVERAFVWGLDLTGTIHGGGGVGGLLQHCSPTGYLAFPIYDANGNVRAMLNSVGDIYAAFGYSAFGEVVQPVGAASTVPFRFATKWQDEETGLYQYNHRYYSPTLGRFLNRDPIGENGGLNLYGYCGNDPVGHWDYLGFDVYDLDRIQQGDSSPGGIIGLVFKFLDLFGGLLGGGGGSRPYVSPYSRRHHPQDRTFQPFATSWARKGGAANYISPETATGRGMLQYELSKIFGGTIADWIVPGSASDRVLWPERIAELRRKYAKYIQFLRDPTSVTFDTPEEANIAGALWAAVKGGEVYSRTLGEWARGVAPNHKGHADTYSEHEYVWGIVRTPDGGYRPTTPVTAKETGSSYPHTNPEIMAARSDGTLVGIGHNHPIGVKQPHKMSGYGHGGMHDVAGGDRGRAKTFGVPIYMTDPWGGHQVGTGSEGSDREMEGDLSGADFLDLVDLLRTDGP